MTDSIGTEREERIRWRHRLPREGPVLRHDFLVERARGKRVVHVGFVDELMATKLAAGVWLHGRLADASQSLVGLDSAEDGVAWARETGFEAHVVDAQSPEAVAALGLEPADLVVAGEIIEHLDAPGPFLRAMLALVRPDGELERLYDRAAVVVLPSYREGLPLCVIEAMAHGRPVVATAVGGIPELVEDGVTGFLVEPGDAAGLREALHCVLADPLLRRRMGREGRRRIVERCSLDAVTDATLDAYRQGAVRALPAGRAQTIIPSLQNGASRPAVP